MRLYHLDRSNTLKEGHLEPVFVPNAIEEANDLAASMFKNGVSKHGFKYITEISQNSHIEWFFEYVRRSTFPNKPSRFESFFAFESISDLQRFKLDYEIKQCNVFEITSDTYFKGDMNLLRMQSSPLMHALYANTYWSGESFPEVKEPLWEYLLTGNVTIGKRINIEELSPSN